MACFEQGVFWYDGVTFEGAVVDELSIIVPALNEQNYLPRLLESICSQSYHGKLQVIVVDGHSSDRTVEVARSFGERLPELLVVETRADIGHQRNLGAAHARYEYLLFVDADMELPRDMLEKLAAKVTERSPFVATVMHTGEYRDLGDRLFLLLGYQVACTSVVTGVPATIGDFILTNRLNHERIGGFVEGALLGEDIDYGIRSVRKGAKYRYFFRPMVRVSTRRPRKVGRRRLLALWARALLHVVRHGPIFPGQGYEYGFGNFGEKDGKQS